MRPVSWRLLPFLLFIVLGVFFFRGLSLDPHDLPSVKLGQAVPLFQLPVLGTHNAWFTPREMRGQVSVLNVWASWCNACSEEQLFLLQLAREGVAVYGLNYKDNPTDAMRWLQEWGNPYRLIGSDVTGRVAIDLGVYGAPETFLIDKAGIICYRHAGIMTPEVWEHDFLPRIKILEQKT